MEFSLLNSGPKSEDVVGGAMVPTEPYLAYSLEPSHVFHPLDVSLKNRGIELGQGVTNHDRVVVAQFDGVSKFEDGVDYVGVPRLWETGTNGVIEELREEGCEGINGMF